MFVKKWVGACRSAAGLMIIAYWGACAFLTAPNVFAGETEGLSLDAKTVERCMLRQSKEPDGLIVFHVIDSESQTEIDSLGLMIKNRSGEYSRPMYEWRAHWRQPGCHSFKFELSGYLSVVMDSIRLPAHSPEQARESAIGDCDR